jgi:hypothetical protein
MSGAPGGQYGIRVCNFGSTVDLRGKHLTYENVKALVLQRGAFSVFEATASPRHARLFTELEHDPEIETDRERYSFPWIGVRRRSNQS